MPVSIDDIRHALRNLRRSPGFALAAILTLVLGIGANTAIFSAVQSVLLRPIDVPHLDRLVVLEQDVPSIGMLHVRMAPADIRDIAARTDVFQSVGGYSEGYADLTGLGPAPQHVSAANTMGNFFQVFGVRPLLGRLYDSSDVRGGVPQFTVLSYEAWRTLTGGDPGVIGRKLTLNGKYSVEVIGVLPPTFRYPRQMQLFVPTPADSPALTLRGSAFVVGVARLRDGWTPKRASVVLASIRVGLKARFPRLYGAADQPVYWPAVPFADAVAGQLRPVLLLLLVAVSLVLVIACANIASLQLVRTLGRARELAVRAALGAGKPALSRAILAECGIIAVIGGGTGVVVAAGALRWVRASADAQLGMLNTVSIDWRVLGVSLAVTILSAFVFAFVSLARAWRTDPADALRGSAGRASSGGIHHARALRTIVITQFALALVLLLSSIVALRSLAKLLDVDTGFRPQGLAAARIYLTPTRYPTPGAKLQFHDALVRRLQANAAVTGAATVLGAPFVSVREMEHFTSYVLRADVPHGPNDLGPVTSLWRVGDDYFRLLGIRLVAGRPFISSDADTARPHNIIIDETLARQLYPGEQAVGKELVDLGRIIGVVAPVKKADLSAAFKPSIYVPLRQDGTYLNDFTVLMRTEDRERAQTAIGQAMHDVDPGVPVPTVVTMETAIDRSVGARRLGSDILAAFALLSTVLAVLGIYGVMSYATSQRMKEFGIRVALGASRSAITSLVLRGGLAIAGIGAAIGVVLFIVGGNAIHALVYGVNPYDPTVVVIAVLGLAGIAAIATVIPAMRAAGVDPIDALRAE